MTDLKLMTLRLPADVHAALTKIAERNERSLTKEIVVALRAHAEANKSARKPTTR